MQSADLWQLDNAALSRRLHFAVIGSVLSEREKGPRTVVVGEIETQDALQMSFVGHDQIVETFAPNRPINLSDSSRLWWKSDELRNLRMSKQFAEKADGGLRHVEGYDIAG